jgi:quercetin dioxygenase-like cupin family protein
MLRPQNPAHFLDRASTEEQRTLRPTVLQEKSARGSGRPDHEQNTRHIDMKQIRENIRACWLLTMVVLTAASLTQTPAQAGVAHKQTTPDNQRPGAPSQSQYFSVNFDELKWEKMFPEFGTDSPEISILRADPKTQATELLIRVPSAMHVPKHWHSANETHLVVRGTFTLECEGKRDALGPGSFNYIPARMEHEGWCTAGTLLFITVDSAWDIHWVTGPPSKADLGANPPSASPTNPERSRQ